jgi:hypothetical protein
LQRRDDREAIAAEVDRHLDRVNEILADHARRAEPAAAGEPCRIKSR